MFLGSAAMGPSGGTKYLFQRSTGKTKGTPATEGVNLCLPLVHNSGYFVGRCCCTRSVSSVNRWAFRKASASVCPPARK